jgi:endonuclease/exonuclease/phosphatase family metal-dependent hydrolase
MTRLATYNIHKFSGTDGKFDPERTIRVVRAMAADLVAIQEYVRVRDGSLPPTAAEFAEACGYRVIEQPMRRRNGKPQSNLLLSRPPLRNVTLVPVRLGGIEERGAICADADVGAGSIRVVATHLGLPPLARRRQLATILTQTEPGHDQPFALLGDLNILPYIDPTNGLLRGVFADESTVASFPSRWPLLALDRIAVRGVKITTATRPWRQGEAARASDHLPIVIDIDL